MTRLPSPPSAPPAGVDRVVRTSRVCLRDDPAASLSHVGGQAAADEALNSPGPWVHLSARRGVTR